MFIDKEYYTSHILDHEKKIEMRKLLDKIEIVLNNHTIEATDFLDPYERYLAKSILNRFDIKYLEFGGLEECERKVIQIFPEYYDESTLVSPVNYLKIQDILDLSHKDYLGALLNLGIKRSKVGDILVHEDCGYIILKNEISDFVLLNLEKIGNRNIQIVEVNLCDITLPELKYKEVNGFLSSLRLDVVISSAYNLSRQESMNIIKSGNVKVNWEKIDKGSKEVEEGDVISIRGYGRSILYSIGGVSKKGRLKSTIRILI